jgi:hypothetical protein
MDADIEYLMFSETWWLLTLQYESDALLNLDYYEPVAEWSVKVDIYNRLSYNNIIYHLYRVVGDDH